MKNKLIRCGSYILATILIIVSVVTLIVSKINHSDPFNKTDDPINVVKQSPVAIDENGNELISGKVYPLSSNMIFSATTYSSDSVSDGITVGATVSPADALDKSVTWSLAWKDAASDWASGKVVTDYVTATTEFDGALVATIKCLKAFGEQIILTVTSRSNPEAKASCIIDYRIKVESVQLDVYKDNETTSTYSGKNTDSNPRFTLPVNTGNYNYSFKITPVYSVGTKACTDTLMGIRFVIKDRSYENIISKGSTIINNFASVEKTSMCHTFTDRTEVDVRSGTFENIFCSNTSEFIKFLGCDKFNAEEQRKILYLFKNYYYPSGASGYCYDFIVYYGNVEYSWGLGFPVSVSDVSSVSLNQSSLEF